MSTASTEVTSTIRDFSGGSGTPGHALSSAVRNLVAFAARSESSRARIVREVVAPPAHVLHWMAGALDTSVWFTEPETRRRLPGSDHRRYDFTIVDRSLTRC